MPNQTSEIYDLVVIGGGPAGAAAGLSARKLGLSVAIIDKATFPRDKLCGGLVSGRSLASLNDIFDLSPAASLFCPGRKVSFDWKGQSLARFDAPRPLHFTMRYDFDAHLFQQAVAAGCVALTGIRGVEIDAAAGVLRLPGRSLGFRALIGADGVNSQVARHLFGRAFDPETIGFGLECEVPLDADASPPEMQIDFRAVTWGYGWVFPKRKSLTVGIGGLKSMNPGMKQQMAAYLAMSGFDPAGHRIKGHFIPFGDYRKTPGRDNILLAGDAAGLVDPLTGEGIAYALESGRMAAEAVQAALAADAPMTALPRYQRYLAPLHRELGKVNRLRRIAFLPQNETRFRNRISGSEDLRLAFFDLLDGKITYGDLERRFARKLLRPDRWLRGVSTALGRFAPRRG